MESESQTDWVQYELLLPEIWDTNMTYPVLDGDSSWEDILK